VLKEELDTVDLNELTPIGGGRWHEFSIAGRRGRRRSLVLQARIFGQ
jgi:hypothetical protein